MVKLARPSASTRSAERALGLLLLLLYAYFVARALRMPKDYAIGYWIHNYDHGFIKRGLVGELVQPLFQHKTGAEIFQIVIFFSIVIFIILSTAFLWSAYELGRRALRSDGAPITAACALVFITSPFVVFSAHLMGYLDHLTVIATFAGLILVSRGRWLAAGLLSAITMLVHEMFLLAGLPIVLFTAWMVLRDRRLPTAELAPTLRSCVLRLLAPAGLAAVAILASSLLQPPDAVIALQEQMRAVKVIHPRWVEMSTHHLDHDLVTNLTTEYVRGIERISDPDILLSTAPPAIFLMLVTSLLLVRRGRGRLVFLYVVATLIPLSMHWIAWDRARISTLVIFHAYAGLFAIHLLDGRGEKGRAWSTGAEVAIAILTAGVVLCNFAVPVSLMGEDTDREGLLEIRTLPEPKDYACRRLVFPNSDFEAGTLDGWVAEREAFAPGPVAGNPSSFRQIPGQQGRYWLSSSFRSPDDPRAEPRNRGDGPQGRLTSRSFVIQGRELAFLIAGGKDPERLYVALEVDGEEVHRATGRRSDHMTTVRWPLEPFRNRSARLIVVDDSALRRGRISVDGFCYSR